MQVEVISRTNDVTTGPGGNPITEFTTSFPGDFSPIAISNSGYITFAATVDDAGTSRTGLYSARAGQTPSVIAQSGGLLPGLLKSGEVVESSFIATRSFSASRFGNSQWLTLAGGGSGFLYPAVDGSLQSAPSAWSTDLSQSLNYWDEITVSDGRGTTRAAGIDSPINEMYASGVGSAAWFTTFDGVSSLLRTTLDGEVEAIAFLNTPAPGFDDSENATFAVRMDLRGMDSLDRSYFHARVSRTSGSLDAVYRHDPLDHSLTLLFANGVTVLPGIDTTGTVAREDVYVLEDGTVFFRVSVGSSTAGFWKLTAGGVFSQVGYFEQFAGTQTDLGTVNFRYIDDGDWAVSDDGTIYFSADIQNGDPTINPEGIWKIDPETATVTTIARALFNGQYGDAPDTDASYIGFSGLTAAGDGNLAFLADLDDPSLGLFALSPLGGVVKVAKAGDAFDGGTITDVHFTPDSAGERLLINQGSPGMNVFGDLVYLATVDKEGSGPVTVLALAEFEREKFPTGKVYEWDGGAGTANWHDVVNGRSNWKDKLGTPWDKAPGAVGDEIVKIGDGYQVRIGENATIRNLTLGASTLTINADLDFTDSFDASADSTVDLKTGKISSSNGNMNTLGYIQKTGSGEFLLKVNQFKLSGGSLSVQMGSLKSENTRSTFEDAPFRVISGSVVLDENLTIFQGDFAKIEVDTGALDIQSFGLVFDTNTTVDAQTTEATIALGRQVFDQAAYFRLRFDDSDRTGRSLEFKGEGSCTVRQHLKIGESDQVTNNHTGPSDVGLVIDLPVVELPETNYIQNFGTFINNGDLTIARGGITGSLSKLPVNNGTIWVPKQDVEGFANLSCENFGTIELSGAARSPSELRCMNGSKLYMREATLEVFPVFGSYIVFNTGSTIVALEGPSKILFEPLSEVYYLGEPNPNCEADIEIQSGAELYIENSATGPKVEVETVGESSVITFDKLDFETLRITGPGKSIFKSDLRSVASSGIGHELEIESREVEFNLARMWRILDRVSSTSIYIGRYSPRDLIEAVRPSPEQLEPLEATFSGLQLGSDILLSIGPSVTSTVEEPILTASSIFNYGTIVLKSNIEVVGGYSDFPTFVIGDYLRLSKGRVEVAPNLLNPVVIYPKMVLVESSIEVKQNSSLVLVDPGESFEGNVLSFGNWITDARASITLGRGSWPDTSPLEPINIISHAASVTLGAPPAVGDSINGFPNRVTNLSVLGDLTLIDHPLIFTGGAILTNRNLINIKGTSSITGDVKSVRDDVQGIPLLAGNLNIIGNVESDGIISMGASPGSGRIDGNLTLYPASEMIVEFAGLEAGTEFDVLEVTGTVVLDGSVELRTLEDYLPQSGDRFEFLKAGAFQGSFDRIDQFGIPRTVRFNIEEASTTLTAVALAVSILSYADWRLYNFSANDFADDTISGESADPEKDGMSNVEEYLFGGHPFRFDLPAISWASFDGLSGSANFRRAKGISEYDWVVEVSSNLEDWSPVDSEGVPIGENLIFERFRIDFSLFENQSDPRFYRLSAIPKQ